jgi:O-succinylbenzoic acid--CoA ligase
LTFLSPSSLRAMATTGRSSFHFVNTCVYRMCRTGKREVFTFIQLFLDPDGADIVQPTSGTTGDPKTISLTRDSMLLSARRTLALMELKPGNTAFLCLPVTYIAGKMMVVRALAGGLNLLMEAPSGRPLKALSRQVDFAAMVPLQVHDSLAHKDPISLVRKLLVGGGSLTAALQDELSGFAHPLVYESFGMTETITHFALRRINGPEPDPFFRLMEGVKAGVDGRACLEVDIPGITRGKIKTNDLVVMEDGGRGFRWLGRYDHVINTGRHQDHSRTSRATGEAVYRTGMPDAA